MKKILTILIILLGIICMIPTLAYGAEFYCTNEEHKNQSGTHNCYVGKGPYGTNGPSLGGIYCAMRTYGSEWLSTTFQLSELKNLGDESTASKWQATNGIIKEIGALCFGHATSDNGQTNSNVQTVIDTNVNNKNYNEHLLAYWVYQATVNKEVTNSSEEAPSKNRIRSWLFTNYKRYGGIIQSITEWYYDEGTGINHPLSSSTNWNYDTPEAVAYAESVAKNKFETTSVSGDKSTQRITYDGTYTYIGPYNLTFSSGVMKNATLTTKENKKISISKCKTSKNGKIINLNTLTSGTYNNFYLVYEGKITSVDKITLSKKLDVIDSRTVLAQPQSTGGQNVAIFYGEMNTKTISLELPGVKYTSLTITKTDTDTKEVLSGIGLVLYCEENGKYVKNGSSGEAVSYVNKISSATVFTTKKDGTVTIEGLNILGTYTIYEVKNPYYQYEEVSLDSPKKLGTKSITNIGGSFNKSVTNKTDISELTITKTDSITGKKLSGIGFIIYCEDNGYVKKGEPATYVKDKKKATIYTTGEDGTVKIENLKIKGTYTIYEVKNPYSEYQKVSLDEPLLLGKIKISKVGSYKKSVVNTPITASELTIIKEDEDSGEKMKNVGFIVYLEGNGYVKKGDPATYVTDKKDATIYTTGQDGQVVVENLENAGKYTIYEVQNPYFGYEEVSLENPKQISTIDIEKGKNETVTLKNKRLYVKISGYVWEDINLDQKEASKNNLWKEGSNDKNDKRLANVTVTLKKEDDTIIDSKETGTIINSNGETEDGAYIFGDYQRDSSAKKIKIEDLEGAYIEFEYNGMCYKTVEVNTSVDNGNKVTDENLRSTFNNQYSTITKDKAQSGNYDLKYDFNNYISTINYGGQYKYGYDGQKYPISGIDTQYLLTANTKDTAKDKLLAQDKTIEDILKEGIEEIKNINLGVVEREMPDIAIVEDVDNVKINLNGYEHTYIYNQRFLDLENKIQDSNFNLTVSYGAKYGPSSYTREVYQSDVSYNGKNDGSLGIYVTYKIALRNEATNLYTKINEIVNYYDSRYSIESIVDENGNQIIGNIDESFNQFGYKKVKIQVNQQVSNQNQKYIYIIYKMNSNAINSLLNGEATLNSISEISSYSTYSDNQFSIVYAGIDKDSAPESATVKNTDKYEDDTDQAPSLILKVKEGRNVEGTVFKDNALNELLQKTGNERERKGNGIFDDGENIIQNVKVELIDVKEDANGNTEYSVSKLYKYNNGNTYEENAQTFTDANGNYKLSGVIPGNYLVKFTYGNNSVICDTNGNPIENIDVAEYKSTIYRGGSEAQLKDDWYLTDTIRVSDAKDTVGINKDGTTCDIVTNRTTSTEINYTNASADDQLESIEANTNKLLIEMEYDVDANNISQYGEQFKCIFGNIDFGIIERPKQDIDIRKEIAYVELTLINGQNIIAGDPRTGGLQHCQFLDNNLKIELDEELVQGATLKVKYEIVVNTKGQEIDYNNKDYYYYGIVPNDNTEYKIMSVEKVYDYLSNELIIDEDDPLNSEWKDVKSEVTQKMVDDGYLSQESYNAIKNYNHIYATESFKNMTVDEEKRVTMIATTILSKDDELLFSNDVEVNTMKERRMKGSVPGNYVPTDSSTYENDDDRREVVMIPATGANRNYLPYIVIGISSLSILAVGMIIIKKKILNKK